jgi:hypothetical protein
MVPVAVRQEQRIDAAHVESEAPGVALQHLAVGPGVEQQPARGVGRMHGDGAGEAVRRAAQQRAGLQAGVPTPEAGDLALGVLGRGRQEVRGVVHEDKHLHLVDGFERWHDGHRAGRTCRVGCRAASGR